MPKLAAYEALLKARHFHWKFAPEALAQAQEYYEQAIALDPQYALALVEFADNFYGRAVGGMMSAREAMPIVRDMGQKALELDPSVPEAHAILGVVAAVYEYNWKEAARRFTLATAGAAVSPWVRMACGWIPSGIGQQSAREMRAMRWSGSP